MEYYYTEQYVLYNANSNSMNCMFNSVSGVQLPSQNIKKANVVFVIKYYAKMS